MALTVGQDELHGDQCIVPGMFVRTYALGAVTPRFPRCASHEEGGSLSGRDVGHDQHPGSQGHDADVDLILDTLGLSFLSPRFTLVLATQVPLRMASHE